MKLGFDAKRYFHNKTGLGNYSRDLIRILVTYYPDLSLNLFNPKKSEKYSSLSQTREILPPSKWRKWSSIWRQVPICRDIKKEKIELYHGLTGELPIGINKIAVHKVVTIHDLIFVRYPRLYSYFDRKIHYYKFLHAARVADVVIAISEQTKRDIIDFLKIEPQKIQVIYQGCHEAFKKEASKSFKTQVKEKFKLPDTFILNVGTIEERKNLLTILKAINDTNIHIVVIGGKTPYFEKVQDYIIRHQMTDRVHFLSGVGMDELAAIYQLAHVFVYPSFFEGFGIPIIEALFSKTPVITSTGSCFSEAGGPHSIYTNPSDAIALKNEIESLFSDEIKRNSIIEKSQIFVQKFNDKVIAEDYYKLYKSLNL